MFLWLDSKSRKRRLRWWPAECDRGAVSSDCNLGFRLQNLTGWELDRGILTCERKRVSVRVAQSAGRKLSLLPRMLEHADLTREIAKERNIKIFLAAPVLLLVIQVSLFVEKLPGAHLAFGLPLSLGCPSTGRDATSVLAAAAARNWANALRSAWMRARSASCSASSISLRYNRSSVSRAPRPRKYPPAHHEPEPERVSRILSPRNDYQMKDYFGTVTTRVRRKLMLSAIKGNHEVCSHIGQVCDSVIGS